MQSLSILIVDDHAVVRRGLRALLETQPKWRVCDEAIDGKQAVEKAAQHQPDIVILDIGMPELNGLAAAVRIREVSPKSRILVLTMYSSAELIDSSIRAGAQGFVLKSDAERDLVSAVHALEQDEEFFSRAASKLATQSAREKPIGGLLIGALTPREEEIAQLLAEGKSNKQVATKLGISIRTVESHRASIMSKLHLNSVSDLVRYAIRRKMIEP